MSKDTDGIFLQGNKKPKKENSTDGIFLQNKEPNPWVKTYEGR